MTWALGDVHKRPGVMLLASQQDHCLADLLYRWRTGEIEMDIAGIISNQILSDYRSRKLSGMCINIHHAFLPGFKGAKPCHRAHARGVKLIGATALYVTSGLDEGPIIEQDV